MKFEVDADYLLDEFRENQRLEAERIKEATKRMGILL
jgi:hypothetical protein